LDNTVVVNIDARCNDENGRRYFIPFGSMWLLAFLVHDFNMLRLSDI